MPIDEYATGEAKPLTMVRYSKPTVVPDVAEKAKMATATANLNAEFEMQYPPPSCNTGEGEAAGNTASSDAQRELEDLLNEILPPRYWEANGKLWQQKVSPLPATRDDVVRLQDILDTRLAKTQARGTGLCTVRHGIYAECFDEIIRQATINCTERGLLLLRIRDEMKMSLDACEVIFANAVEFGMRKAIQAAKEKEALTNRVKDLAVAHVTVQKSLEETKERFQQTQLRTAEIYAAEEKRFADELAFVKKSNAQFKLQLETITAPRK